MVNGRIYVQCSIRGKEKSNIFPFEQFLLLFYYPSNFSTLNPKTKVQGQENVHLNLSLNLSPKFHLKKVLVFSGIILTLPALPDSGGWTARARGLTGSSSTASDQRTPTPSQRP